MAITGKRLTDKEFWRILRANGGLFARTAKAIEKEFKRDYARQSVRERALKDPEQLADIEEQNTDTAEEVLFGLFRSNDERVRADVAKFYLKHKGKKRGYVEKSEVELSGTLQTELITPKISDE